MLHRSSLFICMLSFAGIAEAALPSSVTLTPLPNPSTLGAAVTLSATVTPPSGTGKVTFYDGVTVLGTKALISGTASISTKLLPSGIQPVRAYYSGDATYAPSMSSAVSQTVNPVAGNFFSIANQVVVPGTNLATGDFNGDGNIALVPCSGPSIYVLLGNGDGTFTQQPAIAYGGVLVFVSVGDFNGDGKADLAVGDPSGKVIILLGNGNGIFNPTFVITGIGSVQSMVEGDFNGDGKTDIAIADLSTLNIAIGN